MNLLIVVILVIRHVVFQLWNSLRPIKSGKTFDEGDDDKASTKRTINNIGSYADHHETAAVLNELIKKDGAGSWPPRANYNLNGWPVALRPYKRIYMDLAPLIPQVKPSLDDSVNLARITSFREQFRKLLREQIDLAQVDHLLDAVDAGRWDIFPRDVYNAFYCCIASSRHAYRWATIPVVRVAQLEKEVTLPEELVAPWESLQRHFGCASDSGNNTSNLVLNFDVDGMYVFKANTAMPYSIVSAEEAFARIFNETEVKAVPVYYNMVLATISWERRDKAACARYVAGIETRLRAVMSSYYDSMHDGKISRSVWLSRVQGFYAWGVGQENENGDWIKFDGLSGNQVPLFHALDAFLGLEPYLSERDQKRNVPALQRAVREAFQKHSFRSQLSEEPKDEYEAQIARDMDKIVKRLRLFRTTHRVRAKAYLSQPAPERLPMTAGKSLLKSDVDTSLDLLDTFMVRRISQTV
ncbi:MAG: hypothetical protein M1820_004353 [Bogoriella megaspora]|nr:MAG: hypothetical protein M1820_004353 [Bogoriella megaspora]